MESIGRYEILNEVARGGMGVVYRAQGPDGVVAIKVLLDHDPESVERFEREALIAESLVHPNVVRVRGHGVVRGRPYLVMDYVEGEDLMTRIKRDGPLPEVEARRVFAGLAEGLAVAHALGVVHRDLKPQNVLLRGAEVFLTDFGLARRGPSTLTATGELLGTPAYMAPEQATGERGAVGAPADVYGLGATLYAALSGGPPHRAATLIATLDQVLSAEPTPLEELRPDLSGDLAQLVRSCLRKEPQERPPLSEVLERLVASGKGPRSSGLALAAGLGACALLTGALAWAIATRGGTAPGKIKGLGPEATLAETPSHLASSPPEAGRALGLLRQAEQALERGDFPSAHRHSERALAASLTAPAARLRLVEVLLALGRFSELSDLTPVRAGAPAHEVAGLRYAAARAEGSRVSSYPPELAQARWEVVKRALLDSLAAEPSARAEVWLGKLWIVIGEREQAERCLERARELSPDDPDLILLAHDLAPGPASLGRSLESFEPSDLRSFELGELVLRYHVSEGFGEDSPRVRALVARLRAIRPHGESRVTRAFVQALVARAKRTKDPRALRQALPHLDRALEAAAPSSNLRAWLAFTRGECRARLGEGWSAASRDFSEAISIHPTAPAHLGRAVVNQRLSEEALSLWDTKAMTRLLEESRTSLEALPKAPEKLMLRQLLFEGHLAGQGSRFDQAEELLRRYCERIAPDGVLPTSLSEESRRALLAGYVAQGRYRIVASALGVPGPPAVPILEQALRLSPGHEFAKVWLAHACMEEDPARGIRLAREILASPAESSVKALVRVLIVSKADAWGAIRDFLEIEPGNPRVLGLAMVENPRLAQAFIDRAPRELKDHPLLLLASSRVGRTKTARVPREWAESFKVLLTEALNRNPRMTWVRAERGLIHVLLGDHESARADVERAHRERPRPELRQILEEISTRRD